MVINMEQFVHNRCILTAEQQARIASAKIAVIGAGGLGGFVLNGLARLGAQHIKIVDFDVFSLSNLNRQLFAYDATVGRSKAQTATEMLCGIPGCTVEPVEEKLDEGNSSRILKGVEMVFDCTDNVLTKLILEKYCLACAVPLFHGGVDRTYGQAAIILHKPVLSGILNRTFGRENAVILPQLVSALQLELFVKYIKDEYKPDVLYYIDTGAMEMFQMGEI